MAINENAQTSVISFVLGIGIWPLLIFAHFSVLLAIVIAFILTFVIGVVLLVFYPKNLLSVAWRAYMLGGLFGLGCFVYVKANGFNLIGWYFCTMGFFHWSEYFTTAVTNSRSVTLDSFLLNHSPEYHIAAVGCMIEFFIECFFLPDWKAPSWLSSLGLLMVMSGEVLRKLAMFTAGTNFNHYVQYIKQDDHVLVTGGIYSWCRHPSYLGWFCWSVGTQVMLQNPVCLICYTVASWKFFHDRVISEEKTLVYFFREQYRQYQRRVGTGLPFITGYTTDSDK